MFTKTVIRISVSIAIYAILAVPITALAGSFLDQLLMPGEVVAPHAHLEKRCEACHEKAKKANQNRLCLGCHDHENVLNDIQTGQGYHGRLRDARGTPCKHCHTEHKGRDARVVPLDKESFDHRLTDFELLGRHVSVGCSACHISDKRFSEAPGECIGCHEKDDVHSNKLGRDCGKCHVDRGWKTQEFDHSRDTDYELEGKHRDVECKLCHAGEIYKKTPKECVSCHRINDRHGGQYGQKCNTCHLPQDWKELRFNHDRDTKFRLKGRHRNTVCESCHRGNLYERSLSRRCSSCHKGDDVHKGRNGAECQECHSEAKWGKIAFDHDQDTKFRLRGRHRETACQACHIESAKKVELKSDCISCHEADDVHKDKESKSCASCHNESGWNKDLFFEHDITRFPLIGQHSVLACEACHSSGEYKETDSECKVCHVKDDAHKGRLGDKCETCHNPNGWGIWLFDHDKQTDYPLEGSHEGLSCEACHRRESQDSLKLDRQCISCHRDDDEHRGSYGRLCDRCHNTESFLKIKRGHSLVGR